MKKLTLALVLILVAFMYSGCKNENDKHYNTLLIDTGEFSGFNYTFVPNTGFWSPVNETIRSVHLVLGGTENVITDYADKMSIFFYYEGEGSIKFPSSSGQWVNFGLTINNVLYYFAVEDATLTINTLDDKTFEGSLTGTFVDVNNGSRSITFTMDIRLDLQQI